MDGTTKLKKHLDSLDQFSNLDLTPYPVGARSSLATISSEFSFSPDPRDWGSALSPDFIESDDEQYQPLNGINPINPLLYSVSLRGLGNAGCLTVLIAGLLALFISYPLLTFFEPSNSRIVHGRVNSTGQIPKMVGNFGVIDEETPRDVYTKLSWADGETKMQLVFSDEFNTDGRSFYPGDDPYWEAVDLHYWATGNLEWYDPEAVTTQNGSLVITLSKKETHGLDYEGGLLTTWNKFCFTGGYLESSVQLPGANNILGFWPAIWTMGNLGRAGYGASLEGLWPYTYDSCDVGTVAKQTIGRLPVSSTTAGDPSQGGALSYLPGQRLSRCTCSDDQSHPGPKHPDGTFVGRSAPEIDVFEGENTVEDLDGEISQSAQWAPFNAAYSWNNSRDSNNMIIYNNTISRPNSFIGTVIQQATSVTTKTNPGCYEHEAKCYSIYGFEYKPGFDSGYITWFSDNQAAWTFKAAGMGPDPSVQVSARPVSQEPMYIIINLGMSRDFGLVDLAHLSFPAHMRVDYIRIYQPANAINVGCDPNGFPTSAYINKHIGAYTNPNLTKWVDDYHQPWPKNSLLGQC